MGARARAIATLAALLALAAAPASAPAADVLTIDPAIDRGVAQLEATQLPDGGFGGRLSARNTAAAGAALRAARPQSAAIGRIDGHLAALDASDVDTLARAALASPSAADRAALLAAQNADGGFGLSNAYQSDVLDTALALQALTALNEPAAAKRAADRLLKFSGIGVWGNDGGDVSLTGEALVALDAYIRRFGSTTAINTAIVGALGWLGEAQQADGSWVPGALAVRNTALAVSALAPSPTALARVSTGADSLLAAQQPDGSWGDPYSSALAIRALHGAREAIERDRVTQLADPAVHARDISANPQTVDSGKPITIKATVTNAGRASATGVTAEFYLDDPASGAQPVATEEVPELAAGSAAPVEATFSVDRAPGRLRAHVVLTAAVGEDRDLANNNSFINIFVRAARNTYKRAADWPRPGGDIQRSGTTPNNLHPGIDPTPVWSVPATNAQIAAEGKVFYGNGTDLMAVDAKTGAHAWRGERSVYADDRYRAPVYTQGKIYRSAWGSVGWLRARDGAYRIYGTAGTAEAYLTIDVLPQDEGYDPVFTYFARMSSINTSTGRCNFTPSTDISAAEGWIGKRMWEGRNPTVQFPAEGNMVLNHPCDGQPLAFAADETRAFLSNSDHIAGFDPRTGEGPNGEAVTPLFSAKVPGTHKIPGPPLVDTLGQVVVAGWDGVGPQWTPQGILPGSHTGKRRVTAASPTTGQPYWSFETETRLDGTPVEYKGTIIVVDRAGKVYGLDQVTGELEWSWKPSDYTAPAAEQQGKSGQTLALSRHYLYVPHPDGHIYTLDARTGFEQARTMFSARPYDIAIDDTNNQIYVRTLDNQLGAYPTRELPDQCAPDPANPVPAAGDVKRVSFESSGTQLGGTGVAGQRPAMSGNGRYVAYARDTGSFSLAMHVRDLETGQETDFIPTVDQVTADIVRISPQQPVLSGDGRYLGYMARQRNNRTGEDTRMMFVRDRQTGVTEPVLKKPDGTPQYFVFNAHADGRDGENDAEPIAMSDDGRTIAFATGNSLVPIDTDTQIDVYVVDRVTQERRLISVTSGGQNTSHQSLAPSISRDGRYVVFSSDASLTGKPIEPGNGNQQSRFIHRYDLATNELEAVSVTPNGNITGGTGARISGDGQSVAFGSQSDALVPPAWMVFPNEAHLGGQGYVWSSASRKVDLVTVNNVGEVPDRMAFMRPVMSDDGRNVMFQQGALAGFFLKEVSVDERLQIFGIDRSTGRAEQISRTKWGTSGLGDSVVPVVSSDGSRVAFVSNADDLAEGDTNGARDLFVLDRAGSGSGGGDAGDGGSDTGGGTCPGDPTDAEGYSDLSVDAGEIQPTALEQGQPGQVEVTVRNGGSVPSEATTVRLYDGSASGGTLIGEQSLAELAAGGSSTLTFTWDPVDEAGQHTLTVVADPDRLVFEQDVANNEAAAGAEVVAPRLDLTVAPDKQAYGANETVALPARVANASLAERDARLVVAILDEDGEEIAEVHDGQVHVAANGEATVDAEWDTQDTTPGAYSVSAKLMNAVGDELASAESDFEIEPDVDAALALETTQLAYAANDTATINALVTNRSPNSSLEGARVELSLADDQGEPLDTWDLDAGNIGQGRTTRLSQDRPLSDLDPGSYDVSAKLLAADGTELAQAATDFTVRSSADTGDGVRGTLTADPSDPYRFTTAAFRYSLTNTGNADVDGATVRLRISDLTSGDTLKTVDEDDVTIGRDGPLTGSLAAVADMPEDRDYQASLHLLLADGTELPLDRTIIHVRPVPFTFGASFDGAVRNRVLVWACDPVDRAAAEEALGGTYATYVACDGDGSAQQARFMGLVRGGDHNQIWILGRHHPLERNVADELGARVIAGDGLLVAGGHTGFDLSQGGNLSPLGSALAGTVPPGSHTLQFAAGSAFAGLDAQLSGAPARVTTTQATGIASVAWGPSNARKSAIAATYNQFGRGKAIYLGAAPRAFTDRSRASAVLAEAANVLRPAADAARPGGLARLELFTEGIAPGSPLELRTQLPDGTTVPQVPADGTLADRLLTLPFDTDGNVRRERAVWLDLPSGAPSVTTSTTVHYQDAGGETRQYGDPATATLDIAEDAREAALAALAGVGTASASEGAKLQKIRDDVSATGAATGDPAVLWTRLRTLVDAIGTLERSRWTNTAPAWTAVARLVTHVEHEYYAAGGK